MSEAFTPLTGRPRWRSSALSSGTVHASMSAAELAMRTAALVWSSCWPLMCSGGTLGAVGDDAMTGAAAVAAVSSLSRVIREADCDCVDTARFMAV